MCLVRNVDVRVLFGVLLLVVALLALPGCKEYQVYYDESSGEIISPQAYEQLTPQEKENFEEAVAKGLDPDVESKINAGVTVVAEGVEIAKPFIPTPFGELAAVLAGGVALLWQRFKHRKIVKPYEYIAVGAEMTADTLDEVVRPNAELWRKFTDEQKRKEKMQKVIMPDKVRREKPL